MNTEEKKVSSIFQKYNKWPIICRGGELIILRKIPVSQNSGHL